MHRKRRVFFHPLRRQEMKLLGGIIQTACLAVWRNNCWLSSSPYADAQKKPRNARLLLLVVPRGGIEPPTRGFSNDVFADSTINSVRYNCEIRLCLEVCY